MQQDATGPRRCRTCCDAVDYFRMLVPHRAVPIVLYPQKRSLQKAGMYKAQLDDLQAKLAAASEQASQVRFDRILPM